MMDIRFLLALSVGSLFGYFPGFALLLSACFYTLQLAMQELLNEGHACGCLRGQHPESVFQLVQLLQPCKRTKHLPTSFLGILYLVTHAIYLGVGALGSESLDKCNFVCLRLGIPFQL